ncbi:hypothetical protein [Xenorhabdus cabanillasii]|uniref:Uncharacterized protein n=2 Tax=Xenorhabdus cabanillasii TaxID=351673 RepID=A0A3D9UFJ1_9GAMM|nr:hypothetical protein [Xenorhabdus cabanillasii]PHM76087.1 hypothetical protein Xcab_03407 [Xenorhabdus cabanillasii JM26]REF28232.1 hypothetical protein BDD26_3111 [Xenorhabdus cabanillasii]CDL86061.1 exported hypothetical protein [Xenorhabdus cabanillasii JM26]
MIKSSRTITIIYLMLLVFLFINPTVHAWTRDDLKCKTAGTYTGYITGVSIGYYHDTDKDDHIALVFRPENAKNSKGRIVLMDVRYSEAAGPAFFSLAQTAMLTGQKVDMWCNGSWINGIWLGEGAGGTLPYGLP